MRLSGTVIAWMLPLSIAQVILNAIRLVIVLVSALLVVAMLLDFLLQVLLLVLAYWPSNRTIRV